MKKIFIAIMAVAAAVSCSQELTVDAPKGAAIAFDNLFVENSTRANDLNANNITDFGVYGFITNASGEGQIFNNQAVTKSGDAFTYSPAQYWVANADYYFAAIAPAAKANTYVANAETPDAGVLSYDNQAAAANVDLLFAYHKRDAVAEIKAAPAAVAFTFDHILSRVKFSFKNGFAEGQNITLDVTNVNITNAIAKGDLALEAGALAADWTSQTGEFNVAFGNAGATLAANKVGTTEHFYLIPANAYEYNVTFDVTIYQAGVKLDTYNRSAKVTVDLLRGNSYELAATLNASNVSDDGENALYPIEFKVDGVEEWIETTVEAEATTVATADELAAAVAAGGDVRLTADITLTASELNVAADKEVNVELNGKTLTVNSLDPIKNNGKMTISNGKVEAAYGENTRRCIYNYGEMVIDGVEFVQTYDKKGAAINNEGKLTINNATVNAVYYSVWCSGADSETVINGGTFTTTNNVELRDTWAYAVLAQNGAKLTINGGAFTGNHGVIAAYGANSHVTVNGGAFNCTATYTGNSDWVFYTEDATIRYDESECTITSANPSGNFHSSQVGTNIIAF